MTHRDGFNWTDAEDDKLSATDALWLAMGWLGDAIFQYEELMRAAKRWCQAQVDA